MTAVVTYFIICLQTRKHDQVHSDEIFDPKNCTFLAEAWILSKLISLFSVFQSCQVVFKMHGSIKTSNKKISGKYWVTISSHLPPPPHVYVKKFNKNARVFSSSLCMLFHFGTCNMMYLSIKRTGITDNMTRCNYPIYPTDNESRG